MSVRRQGYQWTVEDLGQLPPKRLDALTEPQSIFVSGIGNATLKARLRTKPTEYLVIKYFGSTPGIYGTGNNWVPAGYINFAIGVTTFFTDPDGRPGAGLSGSAAPYPISTSFGPAFASDWDIEVPPGTDWDITYYIANAMVTPVELFPETPVSTWSMTYTI
ncbi:MAG: hypothetical protein HOC18_06580 [Candidatus Marinimicrobia bacterium]|nr:hypothetical protein [Candidatus Neomarinimicrobiota bacterium]